MLRIFVSWSGQDSKQFAEHLRTWIPNVIQEADVWVSSQDIQKGSRWSAELTDRLSSISFGLVVLTKANRDAPWVLFEAGALSTRVGARVATILTNLSESDLTNTPLSQFQSTRGSSKDDVLQLLETINLACERPLSPDRLRATFERWWPDLEEAYNAVAFAEPVATTAKPSRDASTDTLLKEVLASVRRLERDVNAVQAPSPRPRRTADSAYEKYLQEGSFISKGVAARLASDVPMSLEEAASRESLGEILGRALKTRRTT